MPTVVAVIPANVDIPAMYLNSFEGGIYLGVSHLAIPQDIV